MPTPTKVIPSHTTVESNVKTVSFDFSCNIEEWYVRVNGESIHASQYTYLTFRNLEDAVTYAKEKGLISKDVNIEDLTNSVVKVS